jgi:hypothetical protein
MRSGPRGAGAEFANLKFDFTRFDVIIEFRGIVDEGGVEKVFDVLFGFSIGMGCRRAG